MIDAATFAISYNAFWRTFAPTCELFVRRINLSGGYERFTTPMPPSKEANQRPAFVAEFAFSLFAEQARTEQENRTVAQAEIEAIALEQTTSRLRPYQRQGLDIETPTSQSERQEIQEIYSRLSNFFKWLGRPLILRPLFLGCGYIDTSEGDVISGKTIYEVKTVDRPFRGIDIRQLVTYAALNASSKKYDIDSLALFNPRRGIYSELDINSLCKEIAGVSASELLSSVSSSVSSGEISR